MINRTKQQEASRPEAKQAVRVPPQNIHAEQAVIGCCILDPALVDDICEVLNPGMFYSSLNKIVWQRIVSLRTGGSPIDIVVLANDLHTSGLLVEIGGPAYLNQLMQAVPHTIHWDYYTKLVKEAYLRRVVIEQAESLVSKSYDESEDSDTAIAHAEQQIAQIIEQRDGTKLRQISDVLLSVFDKIADGKMVGRQTGFCDLDQLTTGMHDGQMIVVAARPGMGKTAFALAIANRLSKDGEAVLLFSIEMPDEEIVKRLLSMETVVTVFEMGSGQIGDDKMAMLTNEANMMCDQPLYIDDRSDLTLLQIASAARSAVRKKHIRCVIVDYLQLIGADDAKLPREQQISRMSRGLKILAKSLKIPVIVLAQLNREVEKRKDKRPMLSDLRESGAIEQDADQVWMLHRQEMYEEKDSAEWQGWHNVAEVLVRKNRNGPTGEVKLQFQADRMLFRNLASTYVDDHEWST